MSSSSAGPLVVSKKKTWEEEEASAYSSARRKSRFRCRVAMGSAMGGWTVELRWQRDKLHDFLLGAGSTRASQ